MDVDTGLPLWCADWVRLAGERRKKTKGHTVRMELAASAMGLRSVADLAGSEPLGEQPDRKDQLEQATEDQSGHPCAVCHVDQVKYGQDRPRQEDRIADETQHGQVPRNDPRGQQR